ncbi:MAG: heavy-metal-associated domain-containing protein [Clostridia bacterium]|nr:heavy-metal-associated domain-containing protein [Clostridia bacterium]
MATLKVPGMHCVKCVERITNALKDEGIKAEVRLDSQSVTVDEKDVKAAIEALDDIGFESSAE